MEIQRTRNEIDQSVRDLAASTSTQFNTLLRETENWYRQLSNKLYESDQKAGEQQSKQEQKALLGVRSSIVEKLSAADYEGDHVLISGKRFSGSGDSILKDDRFAQWCRGLDATSDVLYLHGQPGAGKISSWVGAGL